MHTMHSAILLHKVTDSDSNYPHHLQYTVAVEISVYAYTPHKYNLARSFYQLFLGLFLYTCVYS